MGSPGPRLPLVVAAAMAVGVLCACSGSPAAGQAAVPGASTPPASTPPSPRVLAAPARLACEDGTTGISRRPKHQRWVNGLWAEGWDAAMTASGAGVAPNGPVFWKAFLYVDPTAARWTTLRVVAPASAVLYYVPFRYWSPVNGGDRATLAEQDPAYGRASISVGSCSAQQVGYPGGLITIGPACVTVSVEARGRPAAQVRLPLGTDC
jgi:hypothetical protein